MHNVHFRIQNFTIFNHKLELNSKTHTHDFEFKCNSNLIYGTFEKSDPGISSVTLF